jgi:CCR4-NOT transcription complex subunit 4
MVGSGATNPALLSAAMRRDLSNVRVIQRNLVYVVGLPPSIAREELLKQHEYFAQYGRILKIVVNKPHSTQHPRNSHSAYVTYADAGAARTAIECVDGVIVDDRVVKASFGTTKYCSYFLRGISCSNPECMYLHELGDEQDTFTKEDMILRKAAFQNSIHPPSHPENDLWAGPGFPPPNRDEINDGYYSEEDAATREEPPVQPTAGASTVTTMSQAVAQGPGPSPGAAGPVAEVEWPSIQSAASAKAAAGKAAPPRAYSAIATGGTAAAVLAGNAKQASSKGPVSAAAVVAGAVAAPASTSSPVPGSTATAATSATSGASMTSATAGSSAPTAASFKADAVSANGTAGTHPPHVGHGAVVEDKGPVCTFLRHVVPLPRAALQWAAMNTMAWSITSSATWNASQWADLHTKSIAELLPDVLGDMTPKAPLRT